MITPKILNVGVYRYAQKNTQTIPVLFLGLYLRGLVKSTSYYPDGSLCHRRDSAVEKIGPSLSLTPPGVRSTFEYGPDRENWVVMLDFPALRLDNVAHQLYWHYNEHILPIPGRFR